MHVGAPEQPQFCAWCGTPLAYEQHSHEPRHETLANEARERGAEPPPLPDRVEDMLTILQPGQAPT
jgi:hypothetical protein